MSAAPPSTITRTAARDPEFAAQLARAEQTAEINLLRSVQTASKMPKHWRAAAWLLERRNPEDFAVRQPHLVTEQQMADIITHLIEVINEDLPEENYRRAIQKLDDVLLEMRNLHEPIGVEPIDDDPSTYDPDYDSPPLRRGIESRRFPRHHDSESPLLQRLPILPMQQTPQR